MRQYGNGICPSLVQSSTLYLPDLDVGILTGSLKEFDEGGHIVDNLLHLFRRTAASAQKDAFGDGTFGGEHRYAVIDRSQRSHQDSRCRRVYVHVTGRFAEVVPVLRR